MKALLFILLTLTLFGNDKAQRFVNVNTLIPSIHFDMRYASNENFVGQAIEGYDDPICYLTKEAALALQKAQSDLQREGYRLHIFDCFRPQRAVDHFVRWAKDLNDTRMKETYYPHVDKEVLFERGYIAARSGHSRGSTIDLTIEKLDMGTPFDFFDPRSHTHSEAVTKKQHQNRMKLKKIMERNGYVNYAEEWWHFTLKDEPFKTTYFDFKIAAAQQD
ncbi:M15 family metallopeptidase [Sulfurimonas sp. HSL3-7]|uniref:M15 family metallopeptidase n=1 Tax=Sulfonitrofixus jiaomeiensis TaxID=3131938 RepID=UPI0031F81231